MYNIISSTATKGLKVNYMGKDIYHLKLLRTKVNSLLCGGASGFD